MPEKLLFGTDAERVRFERIARERRLSCSRPPEVVARPAMPLVVTATLLGSAWR
jgi:hypothetical protein